MLELTFQLSTLDRAVVRMASSLLRAILVTETLRNAYAGGENQQDNYASYMQPSATTA